MANSTSFQNKVQILAQAEQIGKDIEALYRDMNASINALYAASQSATKAAQERAIGMMSTVAGLGALANACSNGISTCRTSLSILVKYGRTLHSSFLAGLAEIENAENAIVKSLDGTTDEPTLVSCTTSPLGEEYVYQYDDGRTERFVRNYVSPEKSISSDKDGVTHHQQIKYVDKGYYTGTQTTAGDPVWAKSSLSEEYGVYESYGDRGIGKDGAFIGGGASYTDYVHKEDAAFGGSEDNNVGGGWVHKKGESVLSFFLGIGKVKIGDKDTTEISETGEICSDTNDMTTGIKYDENDEGLYGLKLSVGGKKVVESWGAVVYVTIFGQKISLQPSVGIGASANAKVEASADGVHANTSVGLLALLDVDLTIEFSDEVTEFIQDPVEYLTPTQPVQLNHIKVSPKK